MFREGTFVYARQLAASAATEVKKWNIGKSYLGTGKIHPTVASRLKPTSSATLTSLSHRQDVTIGWLLNKGLYWLSLARKLTLGLASEYETDAFRGQVATGGADFTTNVFSAFRDVKSYQVRRVRNGPVDKPSSVITMEGDNSDA